MMQKLLHLESSYFLHKIHIKAVCWISEWFRNSHG